MFSCCLFCFDFEILTHYFLFHDFFPFRDSHFVIFSKMRNFIVSAPLDLTRKRLKKRFKAGLTFKINERVSDSCFAFENGGRGV